MLIILILLQQSNDKGILSNPISAKSVDVSSKFLNNIIRLCLVTFIINSIVITKTLNAESKDKKTKIEKSLEAEKKKQKNQPPIG